MAKIFIAYRRNDSTFYVNALQQELEKRFGKRSVVRDVTANIPLGTDYRKHLQLAVANSDVLLAVIGKKWEESIRTRGEDETDFLRIEIEEALERKIPVVPVLVGGAKLPREKSLPPSISELVFREAAQIRSGKDLDPDLKILADRLAATLGEEQSAPHKRTESLVLRISVRPKSAAIGIKFGWTVTVRNDGAASLRDVTVHRGRRLLEAPFELDPGRSRRFKFETRYPKPGKKTNSVSATGLLPDGSIVRTGTKTSAEVR